MQLTAAHLRYLLAIYEVSRTHLDISSRSIAEKLGVTKPSVVRILNLLMEQGMIVKEYYGKIYLTDRGIWVAKRVQQELDAILAHFPPVSGELTGEEQWNAALAMTSALPQRLFTADYERMGRRRKLPPSKPDGFASSRGYPLSLCCAKPAPPRERLLVLPQSFPPPLKPSPAGGRWRAATDEGQHPLALLHPLRHRYAMPPLPKGEPRALPETFLLHLKL